MPACPTCGESHAVRAKFCPECGSALPAGRGAERRLVTAVFCDLVGSTTLGERLDPESLQRVLDRYFAAMRTAVEHHDGVVDKFIGDAIVGTFGVRVAHEDDGVRAARAALEMLAALPEVNAELAGVGVELQDASGSRAARSSSTRTRPPAGWGATRSTSRPGSRPRPPWAACS
jgi:class 3 adenylate cyclase